LSTFDIYSKILLTWLGYVTKQPWLNKKQNFEINSPASSGGQEKYKI